MFINLSRSPVIDSQPGVPVRQPYLSYRPARLQYIGWRNRFLGCINIYKYGLRVACGAERSVMRWARICKLFNEPRNRFPTWRNRFLGCLSIYKCGLRIACGACAGRSVKSWRRAAVWAGRPAGTAGRRWAAHPHLTSTRQATQKTTVKHAHYMGIARHKGVVMHCKDTIPKKIRNIYSNCGHQSQFLHSCFCVRFKYSQNRSPYSAARN